MIKNERKVVIKLKEEKNEQAFDLLYNEYYKLVYYVIFKIVGNQEVARDLAIDTFLTMYNKIEQHDVDKSFKYWLLSIAKNNGKQYLRNNKDRNIIINNELIEETADTHNEFTNLMIECCSILNEEEFDILNKHLVFDMTFEEIAEDLDSSKSSVHRTYQKAVQKIKIER